MNRIIHGFILLAVLSLPLLPALAGGKQHPTNEDYDWWREARFGVFIHWGSSSVLALPGGGWSRQGNPHGDQAGRNVLTPGKLPKAILDGSYLQYFGARRGQVPMDIYDNLTQIFNPKEFDAKEWVKVFKEAGAKYVVFTTKHQDGYCMWRTDTTDYSIKSSPYKGDIVKELADACHEAGLKIIFYYSKPDWGNPQYDPKNPKLYQDFMIRQLTELCTRYGEVKGFWWDGGNVVKLDGNAIYDAVQKYIPDAIFNGRGCFGPRGVLFGTPEQKLGSFNRKYPWESCVTMQGEGWFWNGSVNIKSLSTCLKLLVNAAIGDGNLLLDFGPTALGTIPSRVRQNYLDMGRWLKKYGESIYGTRGGPYKPGTWGGATCAGNNVYLHITQEWPKGELHLPALPAKVLKATALTGGEVKVERVGKELVVRLDERYHARPDTIIKLELDKDAFGIEPMPSENLELVSVNATAKASSEEANWRGWAGSVTFRDFEVKMVKTKFYGEDAESKPEINHSFKPTPEQVKKYPWIKLDRDHIWRYWISKASDQQPWIELDFGEPKTFNKVTLQEKFDRTKCFELQYFKDGNWVTFHKGLELGTFAVVLPKPVTAQKVRLRIICYASDNPSEGAGLRKFDVWLDKLN